MNKKCLPLWQWDTGRTLPGLRSSVSERCFCQKITDIYATAVDYFLDSQITRDFFAAVQNKMHYAVHGNTVAEVIVERANHNREQYGAYYMEKCTEGKIVKADVSVAKNYLSVDEM